MFPPKHAVRLPGARGRLRYWSMFPRKHAIRPGSDPPRRMTWPHGPDSSPQHRPGHQPVVVRKSLPGMMFPRKHPSPPGPRHVRSPLRSVRLFLPVSGHETPWNRRARSRCAMTARRAVSGSRPFPVSAWYVDIYAPAFPCGGRCRALRSSAGSLHSQALPHGSWL